MTSQHISDQQLLAWLDEQLPLAEMTELEKELRASDNLRHRVAQLINHHERGYHSIGAIWRRHRLSCPTRSQLGSWVLGTLTSAEGNYIDFHLNTVGCRICQANVKDLEESMANTSEPERRRQKYFESSIGHLNHS